MNDSDNNVTKIVIGLIIAVLVIIVAVYAYNMLKDDTSVDDMTNNMTNDMNNMGQDIYNGAENLVEGTGEVVGDVVEGTKDTVNSIIDFTMTENADIKDNVKTNTAEKIKKDKKYESLIFKEVTLIGRDNATTFTAKVKNDSNDDFKSKDVTITFYKKDGTNLTTLSLNIPDIKGNDTTEVTVNVAEDIANADDYTIE